MHDYVNPSDFVRAGNPEADGLLDSRSDEPTGSKSE
jgi:hypothetical protein